MPRDQRILVTFKTDLTEQEAWCEPDGCPASICNGPHIQHECSGHTVTGRRDQSCPMCGESFGSDRA